MTLGDNNVSAVGDHAQIARLQAELNCLAGGGRQMDALKTAQRANGCTRKVGKFEVQLDDLIALARPGVGDNSDAATFKASPACSGSLGCWVMGP